MVLKGKEDGMSSVEDSDATEEMFNRSMLMLNAFCIVPLLSSKYCIFLRRDSVLLYQVWVGTIDTFLNKSENKLQYGYGLRSA